MIQDVEKLTHPPQRRKRSGLHPLGGGCLLIIGLLMWTVLYWVHMQQQEFARIGQIAQGTVIELVRGTGRNAGYAPVVQFLTPDEHVYSFKSATSSNPPAYSVGDKIDVLYNPEAPEQAVIAADNSITTNPMMGVFAAAGFVLIGVGFYPIYTFVRQRRAAA